MSLAGLACQGREVPAHPFMLWQLPQGSQIGCYRDTPPACGYPAVSLLSAALSHPHPEYSTLFRDMCAQSMASLAEERGLFKAIRELVLAEEGSVSTLEQVAAHSNLSARTLRRHLRLIGVSYRSLLEEVRYAAARSFRTAFKRYSGITPSACRLHAS